MTNEFASFPRLDIDYWCASPECRSIVLKARQGALINYSTKEIEVLITKLDEHLACGYKKIKYHLDKPAAADLLIILHEKHKAFKDATAEDIRIYLQLLCLEESKKGNFVLAADAYRLATEYKKAQSKGGRNKGERKTTRAVINLIIEIIKKQPASNNEVWKQIPTEPKYIEVKGCIGFYVFRAKDENGTELLRIQQLLHRNDIRDDSESSTCTRNAFNKRATTARNELKEITLEIER